MYGIVLFDIRLYICVLRCYCILDGKIIRLDTIKGNRAHLFAFSIAF